MAWKTEAPLQETQQPTEIGCCGIRTLQKKITPYCETYPCATGSTGMGLASHFHPSLPWVPSQNGRLDDMPQRQSEMAGLPVRSHSWPFTSTNEIGPSTRNGPFGRTVIFTVGATADSAATTFETSSD